jgi:membrane protease YdiL (CAAX protease family)
MVDGIKKLLTITLTACLIGGLSAGFPVSPWLLVVLSSIAFGLGHGLQGPGGVLVTAVLGLGLGAAFVIAESLALVIVAHYVVNALEFLTQGLDSGDTWSFN